MLTKRRCGARTRRGSQLASRWAPAGNIKLAIIRWHGLPCCVKDAQWLHLKISRVIRRHLEEFGVRDCRLVCAAVSGCRSIRRGDITHRCKCCPGWVKGSGAASVRRCRPGVHCGEQSSLAATRLRITAMDSTALTMFDVGFHSADALAEALKQHCRRVGLACRAEDGSDGKAVVLQRLPRKREVL